MADEKAAPKFDAGKPPLHLIAPDFKAAVARVLAFGAKKYSPWSWTAGKEWSRDLAAIHRHLDDWAMGIDVDSETGESHLAHAACDLMFLLVQQARGLGTDDRNKVTTTTFTSVTGAGSVLMNQNPPITWLRPGYGVGE